MTRAVRGSRATEAIAVIVIAASFAAIAAPAGAYHAERRQELERLISDQDGKIDALGAREDDLLSKLNASTARQAELTAKLSAVESELAVARRELARIERKLDQTTAELHAKTAELEETQGDLDERTDILDDRVAHIFTSAPESYTNVFHYAESFEDAVAGTEYLDRVVAFDRTLLDEIEAIKSQLLVQQAEIEAKRDELRTDRESARATAAEIQAKRNERASAVAAINREVNYQRYLLGEIRTKKSQARRLRDQYEQESAEITQFLQGAQSGQQVIQGKGGWLKYPVSGSITSGYGWRRHPVTGGRSFHTGIDIGSSSGTTIRAARHGVVLDVAYHEAYGLMVIVDHGSSVATLYAHMSRSYVSEGERLSTLEPVGAVGSTGWSTGPHLHFEVRVNGYHQNPNQWL